MGTDVKIAFIRRILNIKNLSVGHLKVFIVYLLHNEAKSVT